MRRLKVWKIFLNKLEAMKPYGIQQLGIYYRDKRGVEIPAPDKKNVKNLLKSMNQTFLTKPLLSNATSLNLRRLTLIQKRWSSFISSQIWNGPSCLFAVIVSVSTSWTTALLAPCGGCCPDQNGRSQLLYHRH
nr:hypothetical protein [Escherichia coli]